MRRALPFAQPTCLGPPEELRQALIAAGLAAEQSLFQPMDGGRSNRLWAYDHGGRALVCKLFSGAETPLFPNSPQAESCVLRHLSGRGLAPELLGILDCACGPVLVYRHVPGEDWTSDTGAVGRLLRRLHDTPVPPGLRRLFATQILPQGASVLAELSDENARLAALRPRNIAVAEYPPVLLHGDVVPGNLLATPAGLRLIDWQCPALGDATEDMAIFLSPAMHHVHGRAPLTPNEIEVFFAGYGNQSLRDHYQALVPAYHWRMAAYCLWKVAQGDAAYAKGYELELQQLEALQQ